MTDFARVYESFAEASLRWCVETLVLASVMTGVVLLVVRSRRLGPATRHVLWLVILIKLVTPPLVHWPWSRSLEAPPRIEASIPIVALRSESPVEREPDFQTDETEVLVAEPISKKLVPISHLKPKPILPDWPAVRQLSTRAGFGIWLIGSLVVIVANGRRILRFQRISRDAEPAPDWLVEEAAKIAARVGVRLPPIQVSSRPASPLLWCLGTPVLLLPSKLVDSLSPTRWRGILAHELAHLRRGDPWVSRLELVVAVIWWWNPLVFWVRSRLDAEAELACDAWVVATLPRERLAYAESLIEVCSALHLVRNPAPSLGVAGAGRFFERRLTMILTDRVSCRLSAPGLLAATLMAVLALPSWTQATPTVATNSTTSIIPESFVFDDDDEKSVKQERAEKAEKPEKPEKAEKPEKTAKKKKQAKKAKAAESNTESKDDQRVEKGFGPDVQKKMEAMQEKIAKEVEAKFGSGSEFEKKMEALGKEMEAKFGPGSEFEKSMESLGKEMEAKFGPGSNFAEEMKSLGDKIGKEVEGKLGPELKAKLESAKNAVGKGTKGEMKGVKAKKNSEKAERAKQLEAQIKALTKELKKLQLDDDDEEDEDGEN